MPWGGGGGGDCTLGGAHHLTRYTAAFLGSMLSMMASSMGYWSKMLLRMPRATDDLTWLLPATDPDELSNLRQRAGECAAARHGRGDALEGRRCACHNGIWPNTVHAKPPPVYQQSPYHPNPAGQRLTS